MALYQFWGPAFAQSATRFGTETWYFCTVLAQRPGVYPRNSSTRPNNAQSNSLEAKGEQSPGAGHLESAPDPESKKVVDGYAVKHEFAPSDERELAILTKPNSS
jgi:hypothetical protein